MKKKKLICPMCHIERKWLSRGWAQCINCGMVFCKTCQHNFKRTLLGFLFGWANCPHCGNRLASI